MCGISVIFSWKSPHVLSAIKSMTDIIRHRGPDDEGFAFFSFHTEIPQVYGGQDTPETVFKSNVRYTPQSAFQPHIDTDSYRLAFGHRRLSILDLSEYGHQPMCDESGRYWITYNGEIYNYLELKEELINLDHRFHSHTDTEVIIHAYKEWGKECLHRFNGMFAFALYDTHEKLLFAARDRFAIKPLYYWISPNGFVALASEIKQFTVLPGWAPSINGQAAYDFLNWAITNNSPETSFRGVYQLCGGHSLICKLTPETPPRFVPEKWYELPIGNFTGTLSEAGERFAYLLKDSVRLRNRADVSVGSCLSGGARFLFHCLSSTFHFTRGKKPASTNDIFRLFSSSAI